MHRIAKIRISDLNEQVICGLCFGYLIDAATIVECLHSFCRSCLVRYLTDNKACPLCCQLIHKTKPLVNVRPDKTLQNLVYKLVPGLFKSEMSRRRDFYNKHPEAVPDVSSPNVREERGDIYEHPWLTPSSEMEVVSVSLQYSALFPKTHPNGPDPNDKRYLLCPAYITLAVLKKFIRCKFDLPSDFHIEIYYSDECLDDSYSVMDVASLYSWRRTEPLRLFYCVFNSSQSAILTLQQTPLLSATHNGDNISIPDEKEVTGQQTKKRIREHPWLLKPSRTACLLELVKMKNGATDAATLCSNPLSPTSAICDEALSDKQLCGAISSTAGTSDADCLNAENVPSLECSADSDSSSTEDDTDNGSTDIGSALSGTGLNRNPVSRTSNAEVVYPFRLLKLSPKPRPQPMQLESEVWRTEKSDEHLSNGALSSNSRLDMNASQNVPDVTCHQLAPVCSASASRIRAPSSTEARSIWSVLPSPRLRIQQEGKSSTTIGGGITGGGSSSSSQRLSFPGNDHRSSCHSRGSFSIYEDPRPSTLADISKSTTPTNVSTSTWHSSLPTVCKSTALPPPMAKVGIVICRGRAMPLQDKHLHLAPTIPSPPPPLHLPPPPPTLSSSSDPRRPTSVKRLLQIQAESENLTAATKRRKLSDQQEGLPPISEDTTSAASRPVSHRRALGALDHIPTARQKVAPRVFRDRNVASSSPTSSKLLAAVSPLMSSPIQVPQSVCRPLKLRCQAVNLKPIERTLADGFIKSSSSCVDASNTAAAANNGFLIADNRRGIRGTEHRLELTTIK